jgi:hypothetical protein
LAFLTYLKLMCATLLRFGGATGINKLPARTRLHPAALSARLP